jgi:hypothetical protein
MKLTLLNPLLMREAFQRKLGVGKSVKDDNGTRI